MFMIDKKWDPNTRPARAYGYISNQYTMEDQIKSIKPSSIPTSTFMDRFIIHTPIPNRIEYGYLFHQRRIRIITAYVSYKVPKCDVTVIHCREQLQLVTMSLMSGKPNIMVLAPTHKQKLYPKESCLDHKEFGTCIHGTVQSLSNIILETKACKLLTVIIT